MNTIASSALHALTTASQKVDFFALIFDTSFVVAMVLISLLAFSAASWGIIIYKFRFLKKAHQQSGAFLDMFWKNRSLEKIYEQSEELVQSPIAQVFRAGYVELTRIKQDDEEEEENEQKKVFEETADLQSIERALRRATTTQITILESLVSFLATTGSSAPFIGLFGTVWGIMESFQMIGQTGNASLATVAPGISEALIATATGLAAAIPAVIGYNYFVQRIKVLDSEIDNFSGDFLNIIKRRLL